MKNTEICVIFRTVYPISLGLCRNTVSIPMNNLFLTSSMSLYLTVYKIYLRSIQLYAATAIKDAQKSILKN